MRGSDIGSVLVKLIAGTTTAVAVVVVAVAVLAVVFGAVVV